MNYHAYLRTPQWQARRQAALKRADYRCQICNSSDRLEVHHRTYDNIGNELPGDLTVLCHSCHELYSKRLPVRYGWLGRISNAIFEGLKD